MKNLIVTFALLLIAHAGIFASNSPSTTPKYFTIESISFKMDATVKMKYNVSVIYNLEDDQLSLSTEDVVNFLQVLKSDGTLEYQLPVFSNSIILDMNDFQAGDYQINMMMGKDEMVSSTFSR